MVRLLSLLSFTSSRKYSKEAEFSWSWGLPFSKLLPSTWYSR